MSEGMSFAAINFSDPLSQDVFKYREKNVCNRWREVEYPMDQCTIKTMNNEYGSYIVSGQPQGALLVRASGNSYVKYWAANPPTFGSSYAGSGMPYPNEAVAYENTPNMGVVQTEGGNFTFRLIYPNSYYKNMGTVYVPPQVRFFYCDADGKKISKIFTVKLGNGIPFRSLTWPEQRNWNKGPMFYCNNNLPVRTQAQIIKETSYPAVNSQPKNFWGTKVPR